MTATADELSRCKYMGGSRLLMERIRRGLSIRDVTTALGIKSFSVYSNWEGGRVAPRTVALMEQVATFYGCDPAELWGRHWRVRQEQEVVQGERPARLPRQEQKRTPVMRPARRLPVREPVDLPEEVMPRGESRLRELLRERMTG